MARHYIKNILILLISMVSAGILGEMVLRLVFLDSPKTYVWPPGLEEVFRPANQLMPGVGDKGVFKINSLGLRGDEPSDSASWIITIGGSTTECLYLDQEKAWPQVLQKKLNEADSGKYWVGNAGKSALHSGHHLVTLEYLLQNPEFDKLNTVIMMVGINDLIRFLADSESYLNMNNDEMCNSAFSVINYKKSNLSFYKKTAWYRAARLGYHKFRTMNIQDQVGKNYKSWRSNRKKASEILDELPDLESALQLYRTNLEAMADLAVEHKVELIYVAQPVIYSAGMPDSLEDLLWMGGIGDYQNICGSPYYAPGALLTGIDQFNLVLEDVAAEKNLPFLKLDTALEKNTSTFYDDCHFNDSGSEKVATYIYEYLSGKHLLTNN